MDAYDLHEARFLQQPLSVSAANATNIVSGAVPVGKVWTILAGNYNPSATETKTVQVGILAPTGYFFPVRLPASVALGAAVYYPILTDGLELKLFPGEKLQVVRDSATAGSTMSLALRIIETDLPFYSYVEPQRKVDSAVRGHGSVYRASGGISTVGPSGGHGAGEGGGGGGGGGPEPV